MDLRLREQVIINENIGDKTKVGYARVSTVEQNVERQIEELKKLELYKIYIEKASAKTTNRPMLKQMLDYVREGDCIYIKDFSRIARSTKDLLEIIDILNRRNIKLISLKERFDTSTATGKLMVTMMAAIYEFERENLLERQREGIAIAKRAGKFKGRKKIDKPENWDEVLNLYMTRKIKSKDAVKKLCLKQATFYNMLRDWKKENNLTV